MLINYLLKENRKKETLRNTVCVYYELDFYYLVKNKIYLNCLIFDCLWGFCCFFNYSEEVFSSYQHRNVIPGCKPHPGDIVEAAPLAVSHIQYFYKHR